MSTRLSTEDFAKLLTREGYGPDGRGGFCKQPKLPDIAQPSNDAPVGKQAGKERGPMDKWPSQNSWEIQFGQWLRANLDDYQHSPQSLTFRLARATSWTPDWVSTRPDGNDLTDYNGTPMTIPISATIAWDVKGFVRSATRVKIKMAARLFPHILFVVASRPNGRKGDWAFETISS